MYRATDAIVDALYLQSDPPPGMQLRAYWRCPAKKSIVHSTRIHSVADVVGTRAWGCSFCHDNPTWLKMPPDLQLRRSQATDDAKES